MKQNNESPRVVFEDEELQRPVHSFQSPPPKIVGWVLKYFGGYIKNEKQANYILLGFVVLAIIISLFLFFGSGGNKAELEAPPGQKIIYSENAPPRLQKNFDF